MGWLHLRMDIYEQLSSLHCWSSCWWRAHGMVITVFHPLCPLFDPTKCVETIHYDHPELRFDWDLKEWSLVSSCWPHTDHLISDQLSWNLPLWPLAQSPVGAFTQAGAAVKLHLGADHQRFCGEFNWGPLLFKPTPPDGQKHRSLHIQWLQPFPWIYW